MVNTKHVDVVDVVCLYLFSTLDSLFTYGFDKHLIKRMKNAVKNVYV